MSFASCHGCKKQDVPIFRASEEVERAKGPAATDSATNEPQRANEPPTSHFTMFNRHGAPGLAPRRVALGTPTASVSAWVGESIYAFVSTVCQNIFRVGYALEAIFNETPWPILVLLVALLASDSGLPGTGRGGRAGRAVLLSPNHAGTTQRQVVLACMAGGEGGILHPAAVSSVRILLLARQYRMGPTWKTSCAVCRTLSPNLRIALGLEAHMPSREGLGKNGIGSGNGNTRGPGPGNRMRSPSPRGRKWRPWSFRAQWPKQWRRRPGEKRLGFLTRAALPYHCVDRFVENFLLCGSRHGTPKVFHNAIHTVVQ